MKKNVCIAVLCLFLSACRNNSNLFLGDVKYDDCKGKEYMLKGNLVAKVDTIGVFQIDFLSDYVLASLYKSPFFATIYKNSSFEKLGCYFAKGNGPDEFLGFSVLNQKQDSVLLLQDYYQKRISFVAFIHRNEKLECKIKKKADYSQFVDPLQVFCYNDSLLLVKSLNVKEGVSYNIYDYVHKKTIRKIPMYNEPLTQQDLNRMMALADALKPDKTKIVSLTGVFNQIDILDLEEPRNNLSVRFNQSNITVDQLRNNKDDLRDYYISLPRCNDMYVFSLFQHESTEKKEFHVINWEGDALFRLIVNEDLRDFNVDWINGILYGITTNDIVYCYNIRKYIGL